jgi:hypothetical protein
MIERKDMKPEAIKVNPADASATWNYRDSINKVQGLYISWRTISEEMLRELWVAKQAITKGGKRKSGLPKKGEQSWSAYVKECFGESISKRSIDGYLNRYIGNGMTKAGSPKGKTVSDHSRVVVESIEKIGDRLKLNIYLPEHGYSYTQYIAA